MKYKAQRAAAKGLKGLKNIATDTFINDYYDM